MFFRLLCGVLVIQSVALEAQALVKGTSEIIQVAPSKCVALNEGRTCYTDVQFTITAPSEGDYCLRESESKKVLQCWANVTTFIYTLNFASKTSSSYELVSKQQRDTLAVTTIEVNWVHKIQSKKRRWRIF